jgi:hypothetical protein
MKTLIAIALSLISIVIFAVITPKSQNPTFVILRDYHSKYQMSDKDTKYAISAMVKHYYGDIKLEDVEDVHLKGFLLEIRGY